jgi:hypothetical protein
MDTKVLSKNENKKEKKWKIKQHGMSVPHRPLQTACFLGPHVGFLVLRSVYLSTKRHNSAKNDQCDQGVLENEKRKQEQIKPASSSQHFQFFKRSHASRKQSKRNSSELSTDFR